MRKTLLAPLLLLALLSCEGGAAQDAHVAATKQAKITECSAAGGFPALDPSYPLAVYCSKTPIFPAAPSR